MENPAVLVCAASGRQLSFGRAGGRTSSGNVQWAVGHVTFRLKGEVWVGNLNSGVIQW